MAANDPADGIWEDAKQAPIIPPITGFIGLEQAIPPGQARPSLYPVRFPVLSFGYLHAVVIPQLLQDIRTNPLILFKLAIAVPGSLIKGHIPAPEACTFAKPVQAS